MTPTVLIAGATGSAGRRILALLKQIAPKLRVVAGMHRTALPPGIEQRPWDVHARASMAGALAGVTVLVNAVGPYSYDPAPVIGACTDAGVHYVDLAASSRWHARVRRTCDAADKNVCLMPGATLVPGAAEVLLAPSCKEGRLGSARLAIESSVPGVPKGRTGTAGVATPPLFAQRACGLPTRVLRMDAPRGGRRLLSIEARAPDGEIHEWIDVTAVGHGRDAPVLPAVLAAAALCRKEGLPGGVTSISEVIPRERLVVALARLGVTVTVHPGRVPQRDTA